jgi:molybdopterin-containing oxidoreductase family iron-sulfur binding subunit
MGMARKYWKGLEELKETPEFIKHKENEFPSQQTVEAFLSDDKLDETSTGRRDFLKFLGFSVAAATLAACEAPVTKVVPYVVKPEHVTPGMPTWYASTYYDGSSYASILVKTREGRPIFIKGNKELGLAKGAVNPQIIASILGLYDSARLTGPMQKGKSASWAVVDGAISKALKASKSITLLSNTVISPTIQKQINEMSLAMSENGQTFSHIQYDAVSYAAIRNANAQNFGAAVIPTYNFSKAQTIVSIGADFLGTWLLATEYAQQYGLTRNPDSKSMSKHFQFESFMSLAGSNADYRAMTKPSDYAAVLSYLIKGLNGQCAVKSDLNIQTKKIADQALLSLKNSKSKSLVVCGSNNTGLQLLTNQLNQLLGVYGTTIDLSNDLKLFKSDDAKVIALAADVISGKGPDTLMFLGVNPVYSLPNGEAFGKALKNIKTSISFSAYSDETASLCSYICPDHHALESWADYIPTNNHYAIAQPTIRPLHNTASIIETFSVWQGKTIRLGKDSSTAYDLIKLNYSERFPLGDFAYSTHNSCEALTGEAPVISDYKPATITKLPAASELEVILYQKSAIGDGRQANNPWLQEMPDPITKATWDNYITMNPVEMKSQGFVTTYDQEHGLNLATVTVNGKKVTLPVYPLPGQALKTIGIAVGYGRGANGEAIGKAAFQTKEYGGHAVDDKGALKPIGANVFQFVSSENNCLTYDVIGKLSKVEGTYSIAATQIHHTVMARHSIVRETTLPIFLQKGKEAYNPAHTLQKLNSEGHHEEVPNSEFDLWDAHPVEKIGHRWGMAIDLSSCIGCGSCLIACQSENNVPVVGKDEVRRGREMHWLRIDRYFASDEEATIGQRKDKDTFSYDKAEIAAENPKVIHMPMMCHHCNHAPCETVCPVAATTHSNEGLNQMAYNRCIGTRYCANNCPYKVRRFNWFNYPSYKKFTEVNPAQDDLGRMVLNPDVTVRTRGVMEKCSFCVQRIQATKLVAKKESRTIQDGEFATACSDACPTNAIVVGDWNDVKSAVYSSSKNDRAYQALEEIGVKPNVWYKVKVRNEENDLLASLQVAKAPAHHEEKKAHH